MRCFPSRLCPRIRPLGSGIGPITGPASQGSRAPQSSAPAIKVNVHLVTVFANVTDVQGAPVGGLTKDDFKLSEDGHAEKIAVFDRESEMPLSIVLAIDTSGTVHKDMSIEEHAAREFIHALLRPVDQLALMDFSSDVREIVPFTNTCARLRGDLSGCVAVRRRLSMTRSISPPRAWQAAQGGRSWC